MNVRTFLSRYPAVAYFVLAYGISWSGGFLLVAPKLFRGEAIQKMDGLRMFPLMLLGPFIASLLLTGITEGRAGLRDLFSRIGGQRTSRQWYAAALFIPPCLILIVLLLLSIWVSPDYTPNHFTIGLLFGIGAGFFEEIGWMGYAFPKMRLKLGAVAAPVVLGLLWGLWHLPVIDFLGAASPHGGYWALFSTAFIALLTAMRVLIAWVCTHTKSILPAMLMHASSTGSLAMLGPFHVTAGQETLWYALYAAALWIVAGIVIVRSRLKEQPAIGEAG
jgi:membrane protease YdiL (CAAX protease family)